MRTRLRLEAVAIRARAVDDALLDGGRMSTLLSAFSPIARLALALAFTIGSTLLFIGVGFAAERLVKKRIFDVALRDGQLRREFSSTLRFALFYGLTLAIFVERGLLPLAPFAWSSFFITFATSYVSFEVYYYAVHRAMHTRALLPIHVHHHLSRVNTPLTAYSMSAAEAALWLVGMLGIPSLVALWLPFSLEGLLAYLLVHGSSNVMGHMNREFIPRLFAHSPLALFAHPVTYHALHHARFHRHYGFGFTLSDRVMKTEWDDWLAVYDRVDDGRPLMTLDEGPEVGSLVSHIPKAGAETAR